MKMGKLTGIDRGGIDRGGIDGGGGGYFPNIINNRYYV
jgi:hypothetical protein